tara:strand:+ start:1534 stop:1872 length:339 start_codon:yes stop_codon:yes gene_type:complete
MSNIRFWECVSGSGYVKLTLSPGEKLSWQSGGPNEEGYSYTETRIKYGKDRTLTREIYWCGGDCDGSYESYSDYEATRMELGPSPDGRVLMRPVWEEVDFSQRDYSAEQANY